MLHRSVVITFLFMFLQDAASSNRLAPGEISMGTTILAVRYNGGIVVGADTWVACAFLCNQIVYTSELTLLKISLKAERVFLDMSRIDMLQSWLLFWIGK
jgi:hypothetical protein